MSLTCDTLPLHPEPPQSCALQWLLTISDCREPLLWTLYLFGGACGTPRMRHSCDSVLDA